MEYDSELKLWDKRAAIHKPPPKPERPGFAAGRRPGARQSMSALGAGGDIRK